MSQSNAIHEFEIEKAGNISSQGKDTELQALSLQWNIATARYKYTYNFTSLGRPIIQFPQDMVALQEIIWSVRPDLVIEAGIAHGGSLILSASMLALLDYCDAVESRAVLDPSKTKRRVLGIDIDIRAHNRQAIEAHPMAHRIDMIEGSSISEEVITQVHAAAKNFQRVMVILDSNHTHDHVLAELEAYAHLTTVGSYCVVFDTMVEDMPREQTGDRPWGPGNNPKTAVRQWIKSHPEFKVDKSIDNKLLVSVAPEGFLKRVR